MARPSLSNCPYARRALLALLCAGLAACASNGADRPLFERWSVDEDTTAPYMLALREYLGLPAGEQAAYRERLRVASEDGNRTATLEYALALSVDRDDRANLEKARDRLEQLLAAPDPLPVSLDALVRLQLGQAIDRLNRMRTATDMKDAYRAAAIGQQTCHTELNKSRRELEDMRAELAEVRRKLDALARIEQTVNENQQTQDVRRLPARDGDNGTEIRRDGNPEEEHDEHATDPAGR